MTDSALNVDVLDGLNPPQREAVEHEGGPLLVLAGAGSGKTRVLTRRVAWLISRGAYPGSILAVTFTNKAAGEMKERIVSLVGEPARNAWIGTFHSVGARILRREADRLGIPRDFSIFDRDDSVSALRRVLADAGISPKEHSPESVLSVISRAKNDLLSPGDYAESARGPYERLVARLYAGYERRLREQQAVDFDDLLVLPVRLVADEDVRQRYAHLFRHVLVDEYQDTNRCQYELVREFTRDHRQLFVVGDDDQSIYRWRGADLSNILEFERDHPDAHVVRLEQNYRSTTMILEAANSVIRNNEGRKGKKLWTQNGDGHPVVVAGFPDEQAEAMAVLDSVRRAMDDEGRSPRDFVVLYRTNAQSRVLENTFQLAGMAYQVVGGARFYERREIKDVLAYLRLLVNPADDVALRRVINVPARGVGKKSLEDLQAASTAEGVPLLEVVRRTVSGQGGAALRPQATRSLGELVAVLDRALERLESTPVAAVTERLLSELGFEEHLEKESEREALPRWENVLELLAAMQEFADEPGRESASVAAFLQEISLVSDVDGWDEEAGRVTLMTLHNAKGLEFPWVFITGAEEGLFPHANSAYERDGLEEERRLFYVGVTRARERVFLTHAGCRRRYGGVVPCMPSRFLKEIDSRFVEHRAAVRRPGERAPTPVPAPESFRYEDESQVQAGLERGMRVMHPSWGEAVIEDIEGSGDRMKLTLVLRGGIRKKVLPRYANLELLG